MNESKTETEGGSLNKRQLFVSDYYVQEMGCFKREMIAP